MGCDSRVEFQLWDEDCFNGTVYKRVHGNGTVCEAHCGAEDTCAGFAMRDGVNPMAGWHCQHRAAAHLPPNNKLQWMPAARETSPSAGG